MTTLVEDSFVTLLLGQVVVVQDFNICDVVAFNIVLFHLEGCVPISDPLLPLEAQLQLLLNRP